MPSITIKACAGKADRRKAWQAPYPNRVIKPDGAAPPSRYFTIPLRADAQLVDERREYDTSRNLIRVTRLYRQPTAWTS